MVREWGLDLGGVVGWRGGEYDLNTLCKFLKELIKRWGGGRERGRGARRERGSTDWK